MTSVYMSSENKGIYSVERHPNLPLSLSLGGIVTETDLSLLIIWPFMGLVAK